MMKRTLFFLLLIPIYLHSQWNQVQWCGWLVGNGKQINYINTPYPHSNIVATISLFDDYCTLNQRYLTGHEWSGNCSVNGIAANTSDGLFSLGGFNDGWPAVYGCDYNQAPLSLYAVKKQKQVNIISHSYQYKNIYYLFNNKPNSDTLFFDRVLKPSHTIFQVAFPKYKPDIGSVFFINDSVGFLDVKSKFNLTKQIIARTIDRGNTWNEILIDSVNTINSYSFPTNDTGFVLLNNTTLIKTVNGGSTWSVIPVPGNNLNFVSFGSGNLGYVGGNNGFLTKSIDGGQNWTNELFPSTGHITGGKMYGQVAYVWGSFGLYKNGPLVQSISENQIGNMKYEIFPNPNDGEFKLQSDQYSDNDKIRIRNIFGEQVLESAINYGMNNISANQLSKGLYTFEIISEGMRVKSGKLIIE